MASPCKVQDDVAGNKPEWHTLLLNELAHPNTLTPALSDLIAGPSYLTSTSFSSTFSSLAYHPRYWVHTQHPESPVVLRFPAVLHVGGKHGKTAPYFNKRNEKNDTQIKVDKMKDMKAIFELVGMWEHDVKGEVVRKEPLVKKEQVEGEEGVAKEGEEGEKSASPYPDEVLKCSKRAFDFLHIITQRLEIESNKGLDVSGGTPAHHGFFRHYFNRKNELARSSFYVSSYRFFVDVEDASTIDVDLPPDLEVDLTTRKMSELLEDEEVTQRFRSKKKKSNGAGDFTLNGLHDPNGRYKTWKDAGHGLTKLNAPQVFDKDGAFIHPNQYVEKLKDGIPVVVDVELRVWQFNPRSWTSGCAPSTSTPSPHTRTTQAANKGRSTRRYELMLRSMKLVTSESLGSITPIAPVDSPRKSRKRKAQDQIVPTGDSPLDRWLRSPPSAATAGGSGKVRKAPPGSPTPTGPKVKRVRL